MTLWRIALFVVFALGAMYFTSKRRRLDFLTVGFFSAGIYFVPGFFGFARYPVPGTQIEWPLADATYIVMLAVLSAILTGAILYDLLPHRTSYEVTIPGSSYAGVFALMLGFAGVAVTAATARGALLNPDKAEVLASFGRWAILWEIGGSLALLYLATRRRWWLAGMAALLLLFDLYIGIRVTAALAVIALVTMGQEEKGRRRLLRSGLGLGAAAAVAGGFFLVYKHIFYFIKAGQWERAWASLRDPQVYETSITYAEPFLTQAILNEVLVTNFRVGMEHLRAVLFQFMFFAPELGANAISFNDLFQPALFPHAIGYGMANNIWAQMWSAGGVPLLGAFIVIHVLMLIAGSRAMRIANRELRATAALLFSYWAFYIHRNDLLVEISYLKRIIVVAAIVLIAAVAMYDVAHRVRRRLGASQVPVRS
ncbi:MAG TPA: hypothetical protein VM534_02895 [Thermoanaerobaculia bacterium]|nr:hypothetical protein [Thermoanaerobaculia bacterium]